MKEEAAAVIAGLGTSNHERFELIRAGVGPNAAARVAKELAARSAPPQWIVSTGFCGGLSDSLRVGDAIISSEIADAESGQVYAGTGSTALVERLRCGVHAEFGRTVCTRHAVFLPAEKRALGQRCTAIAVDMESRALADHVDGSTTRVIAMRTVSDAVTDELPREVGEFLTESGDVQIGKIALFVLKNPFNIGRLMELKKRSDIAAKSLADMWRAVRDIRFE